MIASDLVGGASLGLGMMTGNGSFADMTCGRCSLAELASDLRVTVHTGWGVESKIAREVNR